jgi:hypothetical protein
MERTKLISAVQQSALNVPHDNVTTSRTLECPKTTVFMYATPSLQRLQAEGDCRDEGGRRMSLMGVRREKAALSSGCKAHPANAPAGSNRSSHGGNEVAYMSSTESRVFSRCSPRLQLEPSKPLHTCAGSPKEVILRILGMIACPAWPRSAVNPRSPKGRALCARG